MVRQGNSGELFNIELEYINGHKQYLSHTNSFRGLRYEGERPAYVTLQAIRDKDTFNFNETTKRFIYIDIPSIILRDSVAISGRIRLKPLWLHKLVNTK